MGYISEDKYCWASHSFMMYCGWQQAEGSRSRAKTGNVAQRRRGCWGWCGQKPGSQVTNATGWSNAGGPELVHVRTHWKWNLLNSGAQQSGEDPGNWAKPVNILALLTVTKSHSMEMVSEPVSPSFYFLSSWPELVVSSLAKSSWVVNSWPSLFRFLWRSRGHTEFWLWHSYDAQPQWKICRERVLSKECKQNICSFIQIFIQHILCAKHSAMYWRWNGETEAAMTPALIQLTD